MANQPAGSMAGVQTGHDLLAAIMAGLGPEAHGHRGVDAPFQRLSVGGPPYQPIGYLVDGVHEGDADVPVKGVVVCARASSGVLRKAVELGANIVISRANFYIDTLDRPYSKPEPALKDKIEYIAQNNLVIMRVRDPRTGPAGLAVANALPEAMGLRSLKPGDLGDGAVFTTPPVAVVELVRRIKRALPTQTVRLIGDPAMMATGVGFATETNRPMALNAIIARPDVNLLVCGELHETETTPYVMDCVELGQKKALVAVGAISMEEPAARKLADWLKAVTKAPVHYVATENGLTDVV